MPSCNRLGFYFMKNYFRDEVVVKKGTYINQVFKIIKGHITDETKTKIYKPNDYLLLEYIYLNSFASTNYIALDRVSGIWLEKKDIDISYFSILSQMYLEEKNHTELLLIKDELTRLSRYLFFEYQNNKLESFYITLSQNELANYLKLTPKNLSSYLNFLKSKHIIAKHNQLYNILDLKQLELYAYTKDI